MRILVTTSAWASHYLCMVPLAWALRTAGHEIRVAGQPSMCHHIRRSGMPAVPVGSDVDYLDIRRRTLPAEGRGGRTTVPGTAGGEGPGTPLEAWQDATFNGLEEIVAFARAWKPDLVIADTMAPGGLVAAHVLGVPGIRHLWGPDVLGSVLGAEVLDVIPGFRERFERHGVHLSGDPALRTVNPCPPSWQPPPAPERLEMRWVPFNGPGAMPDWLTAPRDRPRVCVTWGTSTTGVVGQERLSVPEVLAALADFDVEVVAAVTPAERVLIGEDRPGVRVVEGLPLHLLLPGCAMVVHQGGATTMLTAAYYGVPQLAITQMPNQATHVEMSLGGGALRHLPGEEATVTAVRSAIGAVLQDPAYAEAAERQRKEILDQPAPGEIAQVLEDLVLAHG